MGTKYWGICHERPLAGYKFGGFGVLFTNDATEYGDDGGLLALFQRSVLFNLSSLFKGLPHFRGVVDVGAVRYTAFLSDLISLPHQAQ